MNGSPEPTVEEARLLKREGLDTVAGAFAYTGGEELSKPRLGLRKRIRLDLTDDSGRPVAWYLKRYGADAWGVRLRKFIFRTGRVGPARREFQNVRRLGAADVPTMRAIAFGEEADLLGPRRGYIVVEAVPGEALERCLEEFMRRWDEPALARFNAALAELVRALHVTGAVHRDLYASHIFLDPTPEGPKLYLIDLARVFVPRCRVFRWRVKDLAQLKYSMSRQWVERCWQAFLEAYLAGSGENGRRWARAIDRKVAAMRRRRRQRQETGN